MERKGGEKNEGKKQESRVGETFPPFIPASDLTNEAIARLKRRELEFIAFRRIECFKAAHDKKKEGEKGKKKESCEINRS